MCMLLVQLLVPTSGNLQDLRIHFKDVHCCAIYNSKSWKQPNIRVRDPLHESGHSHCLLPVRTGEYLLTLESCGQQFGSGGG